MQSPSSVARLGIMRDNDGHHMDERLTRDHRDEHEEGEVDGRTKRRRRTSTTSSSSQSQEEEDRSSRKHKKKSRSTARSSSSSSSSSDSDSEKKKKHHKKHKKRDSSSKSSKSKKHKKKKSSKKSKRDDHSATKWGARGIITVQDRTRKDAEFRSWLMEVKNIDFGILNPEATRSYFSEYMEDYNLGILSHEKYYNMDAWEKSDRTQRQYIGGDEEAEYDFSKDEENLKRSNRSSGPLLNPVMTKQQIEELQRVQRERVEADRLRKLGYDVSKKNLGVRYQDTMM